MTRELEAFITIEALHASVFGSCLPIIAVSHAASPDFSPSAAQEYNNMNSGLCFENELQKIAIRKQNLPYELFQNLNLRNLFNNRKRND